MTCPDERNLPLQEKFSEFVDMIDWVTDCSDEFCALVDGLEPHIETIQQMLCGFFGHRIEHPDHCGLYEHDICSSCRQYRETILKNGEEIHLDFREEKK